MNRTYSFVIMSLLIISCQRNGLNNTNNRTPISSDETPDDILKDYSFSFEHPIIIDSSDYLLFPISTRLIAKRKLYSSDGYRTGDFPRFWNILFHNRQTGQSKLLSTAKMRISTIHTTTKNYDFGTDDHEILPGKILYEMSTTDYNKDGLLDNKDPDYLYISDLDGSHLNRLSPPNEDLIYFEVHSHSGQIIVQTLSDTNDDLLFTNDDESKWYILDNKEDQWHINDIIDTTTYQDIKQLFFEQWANTHD